MNTKNTHWQEYYQAVNRRPHHPLVEQAIAENTSGLMVAIDAGCGTGTESEFISQAGYKVLAFDPDKEAIKICHERFIENKSVSIYRDCFETFHYPANGLFIAKSSLFFCDPIKFDQVWSNIKASIQTGGVFFGQILGDQDSWESNEKRLISRFSRHEVETMLSDFDIITFDEKRDKGKTAVGREKYWHFFTFLAVKR
ncbi:class I SAM-dependent methyltransferase [Veronia pacifica]|uniref:Methyltransferase domain-containing protein n=1 Tax=Veronia pacifica TaxID=1080227 RepID=A0A1C3EKW9_9GAMM|nr:class I SAM-dependent methyltransferase [Veronia pacifica]ODA33870.1 hypothetical protein A8L45_08575 [Veronia pacifica]